MRAPGEDVRDCLDGHPGEVTPEDEAFCEQIRRKVAQVIAEPGLDPARCQRDLAARVLDWLRG